MSSSDLKRMQHRELSEAQFQRNVLIEATYAGWRTYYIPDRVYALINKAIREGQVELPHPGFPDLLLFKDGDGPVHLELKSEVGKLSDAQIEWRDFLLANGHEWHCFRPRHMQDLIIPRLQGVKLPPAAAGLKGEL